MTEDYPIPYSVLRKYLDQVVLEHGYVRNMDMGAADVQRGFPIGRLFVEPSLSTQHIAFEKARSVEYPKLSLLEAVEQNHELVILGDPGSGKSMLVSWLSSMLADPSNNSYKKATKGLIPIPLVLRELKTFKGMSSDDLFESFCSHRIGQYLGDATSIKLLLRDGKAFILADGLDEVSDPAVRFTISNIFSELIDVYYHIDNRWLLTSRIIGYDDSPLLLNPMRKSRSVNQDVNEALTDTSDLTSLDTTNNLRKGSDIEAEKIITLENIFHELETNKDFALRLARYYKAIEAPRFYTAPFDSAQIGSFIFNWYSIRERNPDRARDSANDFQNALGQRADLSELASNPQLLTLMCLVHRVRAVLPHGRAKLYEELSKVFLETIPRNRKLNIPYPIDFNLKCLARFGFEMQKLRKVPLGAVELDDQGNEMSVTEEASGLLVSKEKLDEWFTEEAALEGIPEASFNLALDYITRRGGLLNDPGDGLYSFLHLSIQEYFAAVYISQSSRLLPKDESDILSLGTELCAQDQYPELYLLEWAKSDTWHETFKLLFQILPHTLARYPIRPFIESLKNETDRLLSTTEMPHYELSRLYDLLVAVVLDRYSNIPLTLRLRIIEILLRVKHDFDNRDMEPHAYWNCTAAFGSCNELFAASEWIDANPSYSVLLQDWRKLDLHRVDVNNLTWLSRFQGLTFLDLGDTREPDLANLSCLVNLRKLWLWRTNPSSFHYLANLSKLEELNLFDATVSDISALSALRNLTRLYLSQTQVADINALRSLPNLQILDLGRTNVSDISPVAQLHSLTKLTLGYTPVSDISPLSNLTNLTVLSLSGTNVSDLSPLSGLLNLTELYLQQTPVLDVSMLKGIPNLHIDGPEELTRQIQG